MARDSTIRRVCDRRYKERMMKRWPFGAGPPRRAGPGFNRVSLLMILPHGRSAWGHGLALKQLHREGFTLNRLALKQFHREGFTVNGLTRGAPQDESGVSLVGALMALAISSATILLLFGLLNDHLHHVARQEATVEQRQEGRAALAVLAREVSLAPFPLVPDRQCHPLIESMEVDPTELQFLANLYGVQTHLTAPAAAGETTLQIPANREIADARLPVSPGAAFARHDVIYLYDRGNAADPGDDRLECHRLDRDGRSGVVTLAAGDSVREPFSQGTTIHVVNRIRYHYVPGRRQLLRTVDGGTQSIADRVASVEFARRDRQIHVRIEMAPRLFNGGRPTSGSVWQALIAMRNSSAQPLWREEGG